MGYDFQISMNFDLIAARLYSNFRVPLQTLSILYQDGSIACYVTKRSLALTFFI